MRMITIITGGILAAAGIFSFANPGAPFATLAFVLGIAMLISGVSHILAYAVFCKSAIQCSWQLAEGLLTIILAGVILTNMVVSELMVVLFFGMWILVSGILRLVASMVIRKLRIVGWFWGTAFGLASMLTGVYAFFNPLIIGLEMAILVGFIFVLQAANNIVAGIQIKGKKKKTI